MARKFEALVFGLAAILSTAAPALGAHCTLGILADLPVTMEGERATVPVTINGQPTRLWLDSGAFFSFMSPAKAAEFGLPLEPLPFGFHMTGIGGSANSELTRIKVLGIVGQQLKNVAFLVGGSDAGNGFIGRNILGMQDTEFDLANGSVKMIDPHDCHHSVMTYWAPDKPYFTAPLLPAQNVLDHTFALPVKINGTRIEAAIDTGAVTSLLSRSAARRAGIDLTAPGVVAIAMGGVGRHWAKGWVVPVANVTIGDEQTLNTFLDVVDDSGSQGDLPDMLLGADFMMAHHVYVARSQGQVYFTYSGGRPFRTSARAPLPKSGAAPTPLVLPPGTHPIEAVANSAGEPGDADGFARRGAARLAARNLPGALADLSEAIGRSPASAAYYADRARVYAQSGNAAAARGDIDQALTLDPANAALLRWRAGQRLAANDRAGALADAEAAARVTAPASLASADLARLFVRLHQPARAIAMFDAVIAAHGDDARLDDLLHGRCWARAMGNIDLPRALADCNRAMRHDTSANLLETRGLVYLREGAFAAAVADFDRVLQTNPRQPFVLFVRGLARIALGQVDAGKADQAAASAIRPDIAEQVADFGIGEAKAS